MLRFFLTLLTAVVFVATLSAQPPAPPNPQARTLNPVLPLGAQRGTTIDLTLTGTNLTDPTGVWTSFPAKATIPAEPNNGKQPTTLKVKLEIPKDAPLGFHTLRVATPRGLSNSRLFCVDDLPQVPETANNHEMKTAQVLPVPCVVVGKADPEVNDYFKITAKANQTISFEILGRRLGSAFDPQITLLDSTGNELPAGFSNDAPGLQTDARLRFTFKTAGDYLVAIRDVSYRGGPDFHYRLRIGDFPLATTALPMAIKRGSKTQIRFSGPHTDGAVPVEVVAPTDPLTEAIQVAPKGAAGLHGWPVMVPLSDIDELLEKEPNNDAATAQSIPVPAAVTARFEQKDDIDHFKFAAKKGQRLIIEAHTTDYLSPTEVYMTLKNAKGAQLQATNPTAAPRFDFTASEDGDFTVSVEHLHSWGGPDEVYRLSITPYQADFSLTCNIDRWDVSAGGGLVSIPVFLQRNGYNGAVDVQVIGPKGLSGTVNIPAGGAPKPPNVPSATLTLKADDVPEGPLQFAIQGKATIDGKVVTRLASVRALASTALGNLPIPPRPMWTQLGLSVTAKPPLALTATADAPDVEVGKSVTITVKLTRQPGFAGEVDLGSATPIPGVTILNVKVAPAAAEAKVTLNVSPKAKPGPLTLTIQAVVKHSGRDWVAKSVALKVNVKPAPPKKK